MANCHVNLTKCNIFNCPTKNMFVTWLAQRVDNHGKKQCITCVGLPCKHHTFGPMLWVMRSYSM